MDKSGTYWGGLVPWTGDTLGSNCVSGFKEGVGGALRICRHCMGTKEETKQKFRAEEFQARNLNNHLRICTMIEDPDNAPHVSDALSTTYGVNGLSVMNQVANFDVCQCFPEDIMHILFEGVVPYATKQCLKVLIDEKRCLTLRELNNRLESFNYGYMNNKNKPTPIARETLNALDDAKLKQSASQMWCLFRFLPIIIGERIDVEMEEWHCLLILWNIVQICTSPAIRKDDIPYLRILIEEHHTLFKRLYPNASIIPKMHFLVHVPDDIAR
ncbi:PREDICTED: uncharacterized protein LOC107343243 [Acropora digitifera]|uniref:uncharacterized protein LOC107343243 n=1 Tax=Acropora digitifera TaxID=70779 RepID=UPI00077AA2DE|nr:PREDICTED: uncharacterized protein LOC107343243 [Acropora digitifera]